ncbi:MAG: penicillin-binding protein 2 [Candidatus Aminicenantes bacterium]|nr:penicillin-binding protein 2 [Candidatus Aminicenantes bacterium]
MKIQNSNLSRLRILIITGGLLLWFLLIFGRLVELQVFKHEELKNEAIEQNRYIREIWPTRGTIRDSQGKILARSLPVPSLFLARVNGEDKDTLLERIASLQALLPLSPREVQRIKNRIDQGDRFIWIKRKISWEELERVKQAKIPGIFAQRESKRFYPLGPHLAHVLGGVDIDDLGLGGIEYKYNEYLQGKKGRVLFRRDALRRKYDFQVIEPSVPGRDLYLTIDSNIQYIAERELERAVLNNQASWGTIIVSNPTTGEILAMASFPDYDPNNFPPADPAAQINRAIQENFEPGSALKIILAAAALELKPESFEEVFDCSTGHFSLGGLVIRDYKKFSLLSFPEIFIHSSNVGAIQIALELGPDNLYSWLKRFGFGEKTGIDLPGEEDGIFRPPQSWTIHSLPHLAIGYEISVTAIQLLQAINIIANDGLLLPLRLLKAFACSEGLEVLPSPAPVRRLSSQVAREIAEKILAKVVESGTGKAAALAGFQAAGKTGTAQKYDPFLKSYNSTKHRSLFVGFVPVDKPAISMVVVLDEPKAGRYYGGEIAAPVFREVARRVLLYLGLTPQFSPDKIILASSSKTRSQNKP